MRIFVGLLLGLARMFPAAALALAEKLPALARLLVVGAVGAGGYAAYDGYEVVAEQVRAGATAVENWTDATAEKVGGWVQRRTDWAVDHPETAGLWGATLLGMGALYRAHRRAGRTRADAATAAVARVPVSDDARPLTVEQRALNRAAATQLTEDSGRVDSRLKELDSQITKAVAHLKAASDEATRARALADVKQRTREDAAAQLAGMQSERERLMREREEIETAFSRLESQI